MESTNSMITSQSVRFNNTTVQIQTIVLNNVTCLRLQDVQRRFPSASVLCVDNIQLSFLCDERSNDLKPLRIEAVKEKVIEAFESIGQQKDVYDHRFDRIDANLERVVNNTQEIIERLKHVMRQMYELNEYTTPRYFFILPEKHHDWTLLNNLKNLYLVHFKLYFLCECSNEPSKLHIAPHDGYSIKQQKEFIVKFGPYLQTILSVARVALTVGGFVIPQLGNVSTAVANTLVPVFDKVDEFDWKSKFDQVEQLLDKNIDKTTYFNPSDLTARGSQRAPLQGADLRELESYLEVIDNKNSLGNLYRTVTDDGYVRWVCLEHYNIINFNTKMSDYIRQFRAFGGQFNEETNEAIVTDINLTTKNVEMLCGALIKGFKILTLAFNKCSFHQNDFDKLCDIIINRFSIRCLIISTTTINDCLLWKVVKDRYTCEYMSMNIKNHLLEIQVSQHFQIGDMKMLTRFLLQNKVCQICHLSGSDFQGFGKDLRRCFSVNQNSTTLIVQHLSNTEFLCDMLDGKSYLNHLKLSFWSSSTSTLSRLCDILRKNSTLIELSIIDYRCFDDEEFLIEFLNTLSGHKSIKRLTFHVYNIKPSDRKETCLVDALIHHSFIYHLHISESIISNKLIQALQKNQSLTHLEFYDCQINEDDISNLQMLNANGSLTHLTFSKEQYWIIVSAEMRRQFQKEIKQYQNPKLQQCIQQQPDWSITLKE